MGSAQTGLARMKFENKLIIGSDDLQDYVLGFLQNLQRGLVAIQYPGSASFGSTKVSLTEGLDAGTRHLSIDAPTSASGVGGGWLLTYNTGAANAVGTVTSVPYERTGGTSYHLGFKFNQRPTLIVASGGERHLKRWTLTFGESGQPDSVTDNGDETITFNANTLAAAANGGAWPNHVTLYRRAYVWLNDPKDTSLGIAANLEAKSDGADVTFTVPNAMGQSTISTTASHYTVLLEGLSISETDLSAETDADSNPAYWYLGNVTDGVFDYSGQTLLSTPGTLALDLAQLAADLYTTPSIDGDGAANLSEPLETQLLREQLDRASRAYPMLQPAHWFGSHGDTTDVAVTPTPNAGDVEITAPDPAAWPSGWWVATALQASGAGAIRVCTEADPAAAWAPYVFAPVATGWHYVVYEAVEDLAGGAFQLRLATYRATVKGWSDWDDVLADGFVPLCRYNVTALGPPVALTFTIVNDRAYIVYYRAPYGKRPGGTVAGKTEANEGDVVYHNPDAGRPDVAHYRQSVRANINGEAQLTWDARDEAGGLVIRAMRYEIVQALPIQTRTVDSRVLRLYGPEGPVTLGADKGVVVLFGNDTGDPALAVYDNGTVRKVVLLWSLDQNTRRFFEVIEDGGAQEDAEGPGGEKPYMAVGDLKLLGVGGKRFKRDFDVQRQRATDNPATGTVSYSEANSRWELVNDGAAMQKVSWWLSYPNGGNGTSGAWKLAAVALHVGGGHNISGATINIFAWNPLIDGTSVLATVGPYTVSNLQSEPFKVLTLGAPQTIDPERRYYVEVTWSPGASNDLYVNAGYVDYSRTEL